MTSDQLSEDDIAAVRVRRVSFQGLLAIEGNPLTEDEVAMFEMFDRERWPHDRCRQYILDHLAGRGQTAGG